MSERFRLLNKDLQVVEIATNVARRLLRELDLSPKDIIGLGNALLALERLPLSTPGVQVVFGVVYRFGDDDFSEVRYIDFEISESLFKVSRGGSVYERHVGSESLSEPDWFIELDGYRKTHCDLGNLDDEVDEFLELGGVVRVDYDLIIETEATDDEQGDE